MCCASQMNEEAECQSALKTEGLDARSGLSIGSIVWLCAAGAWLSLFASSLTSE
ncbi:hypothetical protein BDV06DRAFT_198405 [Aspergillus oleicola]